ncbi:MAG: LemA family protein [Candidatus Peregrinibacteria bacterium]
MSKKVLFIILGIVVLLLIWVWTGYNGLVRARAGVDGAWAQVETQYQRRFDLVPNLVSTVQGAAAFEQNTFVAVTQARTQWMSAGADRAAKISAAENVDSALSRLLVTFENYPTLQATQAFRDLMTQLEGTENRIAVARKDFNDSVQSYNVLVTVFPRMILARLFGFTSEPFFQAAEAAAEAPRVDFTK